MLSVSVAMLSSFTKKLLIVLIQVVFFSSFYHYIRPSFSLSLLVITQIRGQAPGSPPPLSPVRFVLFVLVAIKFQRFLPSSTRVEVYMQLQESRNCFHKILV